MRRAPIRVAVTGTDTGVGKTVVACAIVLALRARGLAVGAMKPVETGIDGGDDDSDARRLRRAAGDVDPIDRVRPLAYAEPLAPWVAATRAGRPVNVRALSAARRALEDGRDALVVEGAGGLLVPFTRTLTFAGLARRWGLDVVVVAANRLGAVNHTLLTVREATRRGLTVRAVALVAPADGVADLATATNGETIASLVAPVPVVHVPRLSAAERDDDVALARVGAPLAALLAALVAAPLSEPAFTPAAHR